MIFKLPDLPFKNTDLEPYISKETIEYHYGKHQKGYVDRLNSFIYGTPFENKSLIEIIRASSGDIFNMAAQAWNHSFYWECLQKPIKQKYPDLESAINKTFGSIEKFEKAFEGASVKLFGSGWTWFVLSNKGNLSIETTQDAKTPVISSEFAPLLVCDVWEHAYYIDYRNDRKKYLQAWRKCVNMGRANERYIIAKNLFEKH